MGDDVRTCTHMCAHVHVRNVTVSQLWFHVCTHLTASLQSCAHTAGFGLYIHMYMHVYGGLSGPCVEQQSGRVGFKAAQSFP